MSGCLEKEILEKFIDCELSEEMSDNIFDHISVCGNCRGKVTCLLEENNGLISLLLAKPSFLKKTEQISSLNHIPNPLILAYSINCLPKNQLKLVDSHLDKCDKCLLELQRFQKSLNASVQIELDMSVIKKIKDAIIDEGVGLLEIILKATDNFLYLIRHTGELFPMAPQFGVVRGRKIEKNNTIVVRNDIMERDLSIEVMIDREVKESGVSITISVMSLRSEEFLSGRVVILSGMGTHQESKTNNGGVVEFHGIINGTYSLIFSGGIASHIEIR